MERTKYLASQLGKNINHVGAHMPSTVVGIILKNRRKRTDKDKSGMEVVNGKESPVERANPYPMEFKPENM